MVKLGEVCEIQNGYAFDSKCFSSESGMPLIRIRDIKRGYTETFYDGDYSSEYIVRKGDFLIGMDGEFNIGEWNSEDALLNQRVCKLIPNNKINVRFVYYYIPESLKRIESKTSFATVKHLSSKQIKEIDIPLPPLEEQHRIVSILDASFEKIDALKKNAEENLKNAKALFQQVLAQELKPKDGWVKKNLGEIGEVFSGFAFKSSSFKTEGRYQIIRIGNIKQDNLRLNESPIFVDIVDDKTLSKSLLYKGDLVVTQTGTRHKRDYGFIAMVKNDNLLLNQRNACIRISDVELAKFVLYYSYTKLYKDDFFANEGGTVGQGNVGISALKEMLISFPTDTEEQHRIVRTLDTLSEKCHRLEQVAQQTIRECDALKQSILRQAFSGEL